MVRDIIAVLADFAAHAPAAFIRPYQPIVANQSRRLCAVTCGYGMSVVASQSEPPTILAANTAQHIAKPNIDRSDLTFA